MYDHPPNSTSHPLHRKSSSKTHLALKMPLGHASSRSSSYQPNTRQADISRLLDPAYASSSAHAAHSSTSNVRASTRVYVDHTGEMHDPDYRDFPVLPPRQQKNLLTKPRRSSSTHSRISSSTSTLNRPDRYRTYPLVARPEWERGWATEVEEDDEDEDESSYEGAYRSPFSSSSSSSDRTPSSRRASLPPSVYTYTPSTYYFTDPASTTSSPVDSLEEEERETTGQSPFDDMVLEEEERASSSASRTAASILRKMKRSSSGSTVPVVPSRSAQEEEDKETHQHREMQFTDRDDDEVPSCTYILHRHLRALNLRLRFGVFHAKRRLSISRRKKSSSS